MTRPRVPEHRRRHGTPAEYRRHLRYGEKPCPACVMAHRKDVREAARVRRKQAKLLRRLLLSEENIRITAEESQELLRKLKRKAGGK